MSEQTVRMAMFSPINPNHLTITTEAEETDLGVKIVMHPIDLGEGLHGFIIQEYKDRELFDIVGAVNHVGGSGIRKILNFVEQPLNPSIDCFRYFFRNTRGKIIENDNEAIRTLAMDYFGPYFDESCVYHNSYLVEKERFLSTFIS